MRLRACVLALSALIGCGGESAPAETPTPAPPKVRGKVRAEPVSVALGDLSGLEPAVRRAFEAHPEDFDGLREPGADDWLNWHEEPPQSVGNYWVSNPHRPGAQGRDKLYILPLGPLPDTSELEAFAADFFSMPVVVLPTVDLADVEVTTRTNGRHQQLLAVDLQLFLRSKLPRDAYALLGLTARDIYPSDDYNYVFGLASPTHRTGVFSFARYDPQFYDPSAASDPVLQRERAYKILAHEFGHMFGLGHCVHHTCLMNGTNHAEELDGAPLALCPVCLRKLHMLQGFDPKARYQALEQDYTRVELHDAAAFVRKRIGRITAP